MKLKNFRNLSERHDELEVEICLSTPSAGPVPTSPINIAAVGSDWDSGKILLGPAHPLVIKSENEDVFDKAREFLMYLATKPMTRDPMKLGLQNQ